MSGFGDRRELTREEVKTIFFHLLLVLVLGGGIGVYFPLLLERPLSADSVATFTLAALAPLWTDILLPEKYWESLTKQTRMEVGMGGGVAATFSFAALIRNEKSYDLTLAAAGVVVMMILIFYVSVLSQRFEPTRRPKTEDGGSGGSDKLGGGGLK
jgi:hypothetical protein